MSFASSLLTRVLGGALLLTAFLPANGGGDPPGLQVEKTRSWAILSGGRVKPLDTHARELMLSISERASLDGYSPLDFLWGYHFAAAEFRKKEWIRIDSKFVKELCGLAKSKKRFSYDALWDSEAFAKKLGELDAKDSKSLTEDDKDVLEVKSKVMRLAKLIDGRGLTLVPSGREDGSWQSPTQLLHSKDAKDKVVVKGFADLQGAYVAGDSKAWGDAVSSLSLALRDAGGVLYPSTKILERELFYNDLRPFRRAWIGYLLGFLTLLFFGLGEKRLGKLLGLSLVILAFVLHSAGMGLRWNIAGRAPVSDMYESLVFMGWGAMALGLILEFTYKTRFFTLGASLMGFLALMFAENLPLNPAISPLVPVLAHTAWLSIHVMTVMLSYSAFALAMAFGHLVVAIQIFRPGRSALQRELSGLLYKVLQVGVLFLTAGIAFGAIWANESWGRYWGWDPKETWSLITFFVYLAIIHARFAGWVGQFGLAICSILAFLSVIMTYYGVNFVLSAGLHSYGFSSGGMIYAMIYVIVEVAIIIWATIRFRGASLQSDG